MQSTRQSDINYPVQFKGSGGEYFKIWIVNILLTILTLYVYSAWAKVRTRRYFYGNTVLDNSAFEYHARGIQLLPGRLIGIALVALIALGEYLSIYVVAGAYVFVVLITPWAVCRSTAFNARMSSYRNVRFGFTGKVYQYYKYLLFIPAAFFIAIGAVVAALVYAGVMPGEMALPLLPLGVLLIYVAWPWLHCRLSGYSIDSSRYGTARFDTDLKASRFYGIYLSGIALSILLMLTFAIVGFGIIRLINADTPIDPDSLDTLLNSPVALMSLALAYIGLIALGYFASAYIGAKLRNYRFNRTLLDRKFQLSSTVRTLPLWWIEVSNLLLIIVTLGIAYPWAAVRKARFFARHTSVISQFSADQFVADQEQASSALGEEIGDAFDMDIAAGI